MTEGWFGTDDEEAVNVSARGHKSKRQDEIRIKHGTKENCCERGNIDETDVTRTAFGSNVIFCCAEILVLSPARDHPVATALFRLRMNVCDSATHSVAINFSCAHFTMHASRKVGQSVIQSGVAKLHEFAALYPALWDSDEPKPH